MSWVMNLKWCTCTDVLTLVWHSPPCWRARWTNHITRRGPRLSVQDTPSGLPADKTSDRHSSQQVQREGKSASVQSSAGGSAEVHHSLFSCSTSVSVMERTEHISLHLYPNLFDDGIKKEKKKKKAKQIYCCHQTANIFLQMIKRSNRHSKKIRFQLFDRLLAFNICLWCPSTQIYAINEHWPSNISNYYGK